MTTIEGKRLRNFALTKPVRSTEWKKYIKAMPCLVCRSPKVDPHHFLGSVHGLKSSDIFCVPLCREHHNYFEQSQSENDSLITEWAKIAHNYIATKINITK